MRDALWKRQSGELVDISHAAHFPGGKSLCVYTALLRRVAALAVGTERDERIARGNFRSPADTDGARGSRARVSASLGVIISVCSRVFSV
ncbi:hypothetical protein GGD41_001450 [Paraburkholderia bryophila]|uniref:Uncharacterized protein n=1 Tax=Paraburkholderia bryophila TaxID=420952 RepID=A0A7Y9W5B5_9BURK|nr:hypothetical protein [Paraburkholderia bryophila]